MTTMAVIFDHDGVMVDTEPLQSQAWIRILDAYGKVPQPHANGLIHEVGRSIEENWNILQRKYGLVQDVESLEDQRAGIYMALLTEAQPATGLAELLADLHLAKKNGRLRMAIASSSKRDYIRLVCSRIPHAEDFDAIVTASDVARSKPAPDIYEKTAFQLEVEPENCVVLEDSGPGVESARSAGMEVIAIPNRWTEGHDFSKANIVVPSLMHVDLQLIHACLRWDGIAPE